MIEVYRDRYEELLNSEARLEVILAYLKFAKEPDTRLIRLMAGEDVKDE